MAREYNIKDDITRTINRKHSNNYLIQQKLVQELTVDWE